MAGITHLLDREVFVAPLRPSGWDGVERRWRKLGDARLGVLVLTVAEVEAALSIRQSKRLTNAYETILRDTLTLVELGGGSVGILAELMAQQQRGKISLKLTDLTLAAVALQRNLILATIRPSRFSLPGLAVEDWS